MVTCHLYINTHGYEADRPVVCLLLILFAVISGTKRRTRIRRTMDVNTLAISTRDVL